MTTDPWPPEGTRVRIRDGSIFDGRDGVLLLEDQFGHCVKVAEHVTLVGFERHEIEVIDETKQVQ